MAQARTGDHVKLNYTGKLDDGTVFTTSAQADPLEFTLGNGTMLQAIEEAVEGMKMGETKTVYVPADEAFGPWREELVQEIPKDSLPEEIDLEIGERVWVDQPGTDPVMVSVMDVSDSTVTLDANHPLAGENLVFDLELVDVT
jgi:FKBP-type peptidyl-prolyl cis-trans isomerase 2